jgi:hypothetical protein
MVETNLASMSIDELLSAKDSSSSEFFETCVWQRRFSRNNLSVGSTVEA